MHIYILEQIFLPIHVNCNLKEKLVVRCLLRGQSRANYLGQFKLIPVVHFYFGFEYIMLRSQVLLVHCYISNN